MNINKGTPILLAPFIPYNVDSRPVLIDKLQLIRSLGSQSCDEEYKALTRGSILGSRQGSGDSSFAPNQRNILGGLDDIRIKKGTIRRYGG